eukprot:COSAG01_NODE_50669_length_361_cov_0.992366_1_plen_110_part_01
MTSVLVRNIETQRPRPVRIIRAGPLSKQGARASDAFKKRWFELVDHKGAVELRYERRPCLPTTHLPLMRGSSRAVASPQQSHPPTVSVMIGWAPCMRRHVRVRVEIMGSI